MDRCYAACYAGNGSECLYTGYIALLDYTTRYIPRPMFHVKYLYTIVYIVYSSGTLTVGLRLR